MSVSDKNYVLFTETMPYHLIKSGRGWKVEDDKGRTYSNKPLPKKRAAAQMRALYANAYHGGNITSYSDDDGHHILIHGNGFITDIFAKAKKAAFGAVSTAFRKAANIIGSPIRNDFPPKARSILAKYAKAEVDNVIIRREPIVSLINTALNFISLGKWNEMRDKLNYDKLFHLSMVVQVRNPNAYILVEKNEVINITDKFKMNSDKMEYLTIPVPKGINFWTFMKRAQEAKGEDFFKYDAFNNNCQIFIDGILSANGVNTPEAQQFVMQNVDTMLDDLPEYVSPFARLTTNIAGLADRVLQGEGKDCCDGCKGGNDDCGGSNGVMKDKVVMDKKDYMAEHKRLIKLLEDVASKANKEKKKQLAEPDVRGGVLNQKQKEELAAQREDFKQKLSASAPAGSEYGFQAAGFDPSEGGTKEPCWVNLALDNKEGGLNRRQSSMGYKTPTECEMIQQAQNAESRRRQYNNMSGFQKFAQGFLDVVTPIADVASNIIPGVSGQIYQQFAPPGSAYYSGSGNAQETEAEAEAEFARVLAAVERAVGAQNALVFRNQMEPLRAAAIQSIRYYAPLSERTKRSVKSGKKVEPSLRETVGQRDQRMSQLLRDFQRQLYQNANDFVESVHAESRRAAVASRAAAATESAGFKPIVESDSEEGEGKYRGKGMSDAIYLRKARAKAKAAGYDPSQLELATDGKHKLTIIDDKGRKVKFGRQGYGDHILYSAEDKALANRKRNVFHASHNKIKGKWRENKFSPNNLALRILW